MFRKMNIATLAAAFGSHLALQVAFDNGIKLLNTLDGTSLLDITKKSSIFNPIIYHKILEDGDYLFDTQEDDFFALLISLDNIYTREVIRKLFMKSEFTDGRPNLVKGQIRGPMVFETATRLISMSDLAKVINEDQEGYK